MNRVRLIFPAIVLFANSISAQPFLNLPDVLPTIGTSYTFTTANFVSPGNAGANQIWDLSEMIAGESYTTTFEEVGNQPGASLYFSATHVLTNENQGIYEYTRYTANKIETLGLALEGIGNTFVYGDPRTLLTFPITINSVFVDSYTSSLNLGNGVFADETGSLSALADGFGTLITPAGTFTDVLRVKIESGSTSVISFNGNELGTSTSTETIYMYIKAGFPHPLASLTETITDGEGEFYGEYLNSGPVGVESAEIVSSVNIFPSPASERITLEMELKQPTQARLSIYSLDGNLITEWGKSQCAAGNNSLILDIGHLTSGFYLLQISTPEGVRTEKFIVN